MQQSKYLLTYTYTVVNTQISISKLQENSGIVWNNNRKNRQMQEQLEKRKMTRN